MRKSFCVFVMFVSLLACSLHAQTRLDIRLAETQPGEGLTEAIVDHLDRKVYLHDSSIITNADVVAARVVAPPDAPTLSVAISLTPDAAARMESATRDHQGRPLAILVNGTVVSAPVLRGVIRQDAMISGNFTRPEAEAIVAGLTGR
jgi:preprotein translocase subunit SecD